MPQLLRLASLAADIAANGQREPIWLDPEDRIIDGRNRFLACQRAKVEPLFRTWDGQGSLVGFVVSLNLKRRHLSESQRALVAAEIANMTEGRPAKTQHKSGVSVSVTQAAELLNVHQNTVHSARKVIREGTAEEVAAVKSGAVAVTTLAKQIRASPPSPPSPRRRPGRAASTKP